MFFHIMSTELQRGKFWGMNFNAMNFKSSVTPTKSEEL